ncbi:hypothetical protein C0993_006959 [Termitomyces sp. T159_Od127]|nr:hypothetical protein C0993_006959 [Termitomyces sp. T159_Od127]
MSHPVNTLVDSGTTDHFIDKSLATLAAMPWRLPISIYFTLFDSSSTSAGDITHYVQTTLTFTNGQQQDLWLLVTHLHTSTLLILSLSWLCTTNPCIDWQHFTLYFDQQALKHPKPISFNVTTLVSVANNLVTPQKSSPPSLTPGPPACFKPTTAKTITKIHLSSIVLNNGLWFSVNLLVTQLLETTPIMLELPWLCDINADINWRDLTIKFPGTGACLAAAHLHLQPIDNSSEARTTGTPTASLDDLSNPPSP